MTQELNNLVEDGRRWILRYLKDVTSSSNAELRKNVINQLNMKIRNVDGFDKITHHTKPIHQLAFILAYKELESTGQIRIERPHAFMRIPFPMTGSETIFSFKGGKPQ